MLHPAYPEDVTSAERESGFSRMEVESLGNLRESVEVAGQVLSPTDLLVKTLDLNNRVIYAHKRWARLWLPLSATPTAPRWHPIKAMKLEEVQEYVAGTFRETESLMPGITPSETPFGYRSLQ